MYQWDEAKRLSNLEKHGLDFADAHLVYEDPGKVTLPAAYADENRRQDMAIVEALGGTPALIYTYVMPW